MIFNNRGFLSCDINEYYEFRIIFINGHTDVERKAEKL